MARNFRYFGFAMRKQWRGSLFPHSRERCRAFAAAERVLHPRIAVVICLDKCRPQQSEEKRPVSEKLSRQHQH
jgi:hypothetical protein